MPGKKYTYEIFINDLKVERDYVMEFQSQKLWKWRTDPPDVSFVIGSCSYVNEPKFDRPGNPTEIILKYLIQFTVKIQILCFG